MAQRQKKISKQQDAEDSTTDARPLAGGERIIRTREKPGIDIFDRLLGKEAKAAKGISLGAGQAKAERIPPAAAMGSYPVAASDDDEDDEDDEGFPDEPLPGEPVADKEDGRGFGGKVAEGFDEEESGEEKSSAEDDEEAGAEQEDDGAEDNEEEFTDEESEEEGGEEKSVKTDEEAEESEGEIVEAGTVEEGARAERAGKIAAAQGRAEKPAPEAIRRTIIEKAQSASAADNEPAEAPSSVRLTFLEDVGKNSVFIGRKKGVFKRYGCDGALQIGKVSEPEHNGKSVYLDSLNPHVVFICGSRGSGKSYDMGVISEELALRNLNVGSIVIDPVGVFWSMKFPNREEKELRMLNEWGLEPKGLDNIKVFIPEGMKKETPKETYDATFSIPVSLLTAEDWALTYGIERFSPTGLLLDIAIKKVRQGYTTVSGKQAKPKAKGHSIDDMIVCLQSDAELNSRERGYKPDSIRALVSRFEAAKAWGVFSEKGTPLAELSKEGQLTVIDTSFLEDNVTALVIGILARRILAARKITTRKEAAKRFKTTDVDQLLELEIPPTWLFIDEAHTLIPSGNVKTPATEALVEYVKQGRRPGCSLVFATQQPSAIDTKVLSQLDILMVHKLVFDDDIKAVYRRAPTIVPAQYKHSGFIKTLQQGKGLVADRSEETSRAFVMTIRPRMSQHEGREAETSERHIKASPQQVENLAAEMLIAKLEQDSSVDMKTVESVIATLNAKYKSNIALPKVLSLLERRGTSIGRDSVSIATAEPEAEEREEKMHAQAQAPEQPEAAVEVLALPMRLAKQDAERIAAARVKKRMFGLLGKSEHLKAVSQKYLTLWKVKYETYTTPREFVARECYISSLTGEFVHFAKNEIVESKGLSAVYSIGSDEMQVLKALAKKEATMDELGKGTEISEGRIRRILASLAESGLVFAGSRNGKEVFKLREKLDLPPSEGHPLLASLSSMPLERLDAAEREREPYTKQQVLEVVKKLWPNVVVKHITEVYRPVYKAVYGNAAGEERALYIDGITGKVM